MVAFAQDTQHEKISRGGFYICSITFLVLKFHYPIFAGLAVGIALLMYGRLEEADTLIDSLCNDKVDRAETFHFRLK